MGWFLTGFDDHHVGPRWSLKAAHGDGLVRLGWTGNFAIHVCIMAIIKGVGIASIREWTERKESLFSGTL